MPDNGKNRDWVNEIERRKYLQALGVGGAAGLAGCFGGDDGSDGSDGEDGSDGSGDGNGGSQKIELDEEIELLTWILSFLEDSITGYLNDFENEYDDKYANLETNWVDRGPTTEDVISYFQSRLQSGNPPNVFDLQFASFVQYAEEDIWADLENWADDEWLSQYPEAVVDIGRIDGTLYNIPWYVGTETMYINQQYFDEAGLDRPTADNPYTTEEYLDAAEEIYDNTSAQFGLVLRTSDFVIWPWFLSEGIRLLNEDQTEATLNTDRTVEILSRMAELTDKGVIPEVSWTGGTKEFSQVFGAGNTAMQFDKGSSLRRVQNAGSDWVSPETLKLSGSPHNENYGGMLTGHSLGVVTTGHSEAVQEASFDLIKVMMNKKWQKDFLRNTTVLVPHTEAVNEMVDDDEFTSNNPHLGVLYEIWNKVSDQVWQRPMVPAAADMEQALKEEFSAAGLGEKSPEDAAATAEERINQALNS